MIVLTSTPTKGLLIEWLIDGVWLDCECDYVWRSVTTMTMTESYEYESGQTPLASLNQSVDTQSQTHWLSQSPHSLLSPES